MIIAVLATRSITVHPSENNKTNFFESQIWYSMTLLFARRLLTIVIMTCLPFFLDAQPVPMNETGTSRAAKPYKILTSGKQVTIKSSRDIKSVMVWTSSGHRIIEEKGVNATSFSFNLNVNEKVFFIRIEFEGTKPYTEKIGV